MSENLPNRSSITGFAYYLSEHQLLDKQVGVNALNESASQGISFPDYLVKQQLVDSSLLTKLSSSYYGLPCCDISAFNLELIPKEFLNLQFVKKRSALPIFIKNGYIFLAVSDPTSESLRDIGFLTGLAVRLVIADRNHLNHLLDSLLSTLIISEFDDSSQSVKGQSVKTNRNENAQVESYDVDSAPVINYVNKIIISAIEKGASDIHFERFANEYRIRYRINGVLYAIASPPLKIANYLLTRIKIMSDLDITEHRIPQDGRFKISISKYKSIDFRVSVCPTLYGEKIVLRLLDPSRIFHSIDELGMEEVQHKHLLNALRHTQGFILVTGPTGSGKTVTL
jgi:type IV pilus assembly protein PilB